LGFKHKGEEMGTLHDVITQELEASLSFHPIPLNVLGK
jgi:hypothetical protein